MSFEATPKRESYTRGGAGNEDNMFPLVTRTVLEPPLLQDQCSLEKTFMEPEKSSLKTCLENSSMKTFLASEIFNENLSGQRSLH